MFQLLMGDIESLKKCKFWPEATKRFKFQKHWPETLKVLKYMKFKPQTTFIDNFQLLLRRRRKF